MVFFRRKKVGYRHYWYEVASHRVDGKVKQKIIRYWGPEVPVYGRFYHRGPWTPAQLKRASSPPATTRQMPALSGGERLESVPQPSAPWNLGPDRG